MKNNIKEQELKAQIAGLNVRIERLELNNEENKKVIESLKSKSKEFKAKLVNFIMEN